MILALKAWLTGLSVAGKVGVAGVVAATGLVTVPVVTGCRESPVTRESIEAVKIAPSISYVKNGSVPIGETKTVQEGIDGEKSVKYQVVSECNEEKSRTVISEEQVKAAVGSVVANGTKRVVTEDVVVPFPKTNENNASMPKGATQIKSIGMNGTKRVTYELSQNEGEPEIKTQISESILVAPVAEVTYVGTRVQPNCDANYSGGCVPVVNYDLDCADIGFTVYVIGYDTHRFDRDGDGVGCESY